MGLTMYELCAMDAESFKALFNRLGTVRAVSAHLGVSKRTVSKYRQQLGIDVVSHRPKKAVGTLTFASDYGAVAKWIAAHPGVKLPFDTQKASELTGIPVSNIRYYIARRSKRVRQWARSLGPLQSLKPTTVFTDVLGRRIPVHYVTGYTLSADGRRMVLRLDVDLGPTYSTTIMMTVRAYAALFKATYDDGLEDVDEGASAT